MRRFGCSLMGLLVVALAACAQSAEQLPPTENLDAVLRGWEKTVADLKRFVIFSERSTKDTMLNTVDGPTKYIWTEKELFEFAPTERKISIYAVSQIKQVTAEVESPLTLLFGVTAEQAKTRYVMEYKGSDMHYHYIRILPRQKQLISGVTEVRLSLFRANHLPAQIWYQEPGKETTWNFAKVQIPTQIPLTYFHPAIPPGWTVERIQPEAPARNKP